MGRVLGQAPGRGPWQQAKLWQRGQVPPPAAPEALAAPHGGRAPNKKGELGEWGRRREGLRSLRSSEENGPSCTLHMLASSSAAGPKRPSQKSELFPALTTLLAMARSLKPQGRQNAKQAKQAKQGKQGKHSTPKSGKPGKRKAPGRLFRLSAAGLCDTVLPQAVPPKKERRRGGSRELAESRRNLAQLVSSPLACWTMGRPKEATDDPVALSDRHVAEAESVAGGRGQSLQLYLPL